MTVADLIALLQDMPEDAEVRLAHQPSWPFEYSIGRVVAVAIGGADELPVVYIASADQLGYLPGEAAQELGWRYWMPPHR